MLATPNLTRPFKLEVDASAVGAGAVLLQEDAGGIDHTVCYFSQKFLKHQLSYSTIEKKTVTLLLALQHFKVYVGSTPTTILSFFSRLCVSTTSSSCGGHLYYRTITCRYTTRWGQKMCSHMLFLGYSVYSAIRWCVKKKKTMGFALREGVLWLYVYTPSVCVCVCGGLWVDLLCLQGVDCPIPAH